MAVWPGLWLASAACWGLRNDRRHQYPAAARLVRFAVPLVHVLEGCQVKTPDTTKAASSAPGQGGQIIAPGGLPAKLNTVTAEVLARLLNHERLTSLDAVSEASTTRLSAVTFYLVGKYQWPIEARDKAAGCRDGRVAWVAEYLLSPEVITQAMAAGAGDWCAKVRAARLARRAHAAQARRDADRANAARNTRRQHPEQWGLFEGGM